MGTIAKNQNEIHEEVVNILALIRGNPAVYNKLSSHITCEMDILKQKSNFTQCFTRMAKLVLDLRKEHVLNGSEDRALGEYLDPRKEMTKGWRKLLKEEVQNLLSSEYSF